MSFLSETNNNSLSGPPMWFIPVIVTLGFIIVVLTGLIIYTSYRLCRTRCFHNQFEVQEEEQHVTECDNVIADPVRHICTCLQKAYPEMGKKHKPNKLLPLMQQRSNFLIQCRAPDINQIYQPMSFTPHVLQPPMIQYDECEMRYYFPQQQFSYPTVLTNSRMNYNEPFALSPPFDAFEPFSVASASHNTTPMTKKKIKAKSKKYARRNTGESYHELN